MRRGQPQRIRHQILICIHLRLGRRHIALRRQKRKAADKGARTASEKNHKDPVAKGPRNPPGPLHVVHMIQPFICCSEIILYTKFILYIALETAAVHICELFSALPARIHIAPAVPLSAFFHNRQKNTVIFLTVPQPVVFVILA